MSKCGSQGPKSVAASQRPVMNYSEPVLPGWSPYGSLKPGLGGAVRVAGSQGPALSTDGSSGTPGVKRAGGEGKGMGTNRKG